MKSKILILALLIPLILLPLKVLAQIPATIYGYVYMPDGSPAAGATVTVSGSGVSASTTTNSQGYYEITFSVSSVPVTVTVKATKDGYSGSVTRSVEGAVRIDITLKAPPPPPSTKKATSLKIQVNGTVFAVNSTVEVKGKLSPAMSVDVEITIRNPLGETSRVTVKTASDGSFTYTFKVDIAGKWSVYAYFKGTGDYASSKSNTITFYVKYSVSITAWAKAGEKAVTVYGKINPPSADVTVLVYMSIDGGKTWFYVANTTTSEDGSFEVEVKIRVYGNILFKVVVPETETTIKAEVTSPLAAQLKSPREKELEQQVTQLQEEKKALEEKLSNATTRIEALENELESVKTQLSQALSENEKLKAELNETTTQLEKLSVKFSKLKEESEKLKLLLYTAVPLSLAAGLTIGYFIGRRKAKGKETKKEEKQVSSTKSE